MQGALRNTEKKMGGALRFFIVGILTIAATVVVNLVVRTLAFMSFPIAPTFPPLQIGQLSLSTAVYVGIGVLVYALVVRFSKRPVRIYTIIALIALLLSLVPVCLLFFYPDPKMYPGITPLAISILIVLHIIDATIVLVLLTRLASPKGGQQRFRDQRSELKLLVVMKPQR